MELINRQCQECLGYLMDDGVSDLCFCDDWDDEGEELEEVCDD